MSRITTHVLDTARGQPASGLTVTLQRLGERHEAATLGTQDTDSDGRAHSLVPADEILPPGRYRLVFNTADYLRAHGHVAFFPSVTVDFEVRDTASHYHVPLLLSPYGYSTYRGS